MLRRLRKRAQTTAEYAILIAIVIGAIVAMQVYVRRGLQGRVRDVVDDVDLGGSITTSGANLNTIFNTGQYEPYYLTSNAQTNQLANETENLQASGGVERDSTTNTDVIRDQTIGW